MKSLRSLESPLSFRSRSFLVAGGTRETPDSVFTDEDSDEERELPTGRLGSNKGDGSTISIGIPSQDIEEILFPFASNCSTPYSGTAGRTTSGLRAADWRASWYRSCTVRLTILFLPKQPVDARAVISRMQKIREELNDANQVMDEASWEHDA